MKIPFTIIAMLLLAGCKSYSEKMAMLKQDLELDSSVSEYRVYDLQGSNRLLALEEQGRLCQLKGDWRGSADQYEKAMEHVYYCTETKAVVSVEDALEDAIAATYGNEMSRGYRPIAFEQMMIHTLDAFNRMALGEWDCVGVNVRNLETWRNEAMTCIEKDEKALKENSAAPDNSIAERVFRENAVEHSTDNVYSLYLIGMYREAIGDKMNARKAYRDIERIRYGTPTVRDAINNLDGALPSDEGEVVVFVEEGFIPQKREYATYADGIVTFIASATPTYSSFDCMPHDGGALIVKEGGERVAKTKLLCDFAPLAAKALDETMAGIIARQISRTTTKAVTQGVLSAIAIGAFTAVAVGSGEAGSGAALVAVGGAATFGSIAMGIYTKASERADLRSWQLLPRQVQIARFKMKPGSHALLLQKSGMSQDVQVNVKTGKISVVYCITAPNIMRSFSVCLDKIK